MRQKILIAAALMHNPDLILLDEPLSGLDVNAAIMIKDLIAALASEGKTILYSSHVLDVVEKVCQRVLIIHQGNLIADGTVEDPESFNEPIHAGRGIPQAHPFGRCGPWRGPHRCRAAALKTMPETITKLLRGPALYPGS